MSSRALPCPHCNRPISMTLRQFFPSRRYPVICPFCSGVARLPWSTVASGLGVFLATMGVAFVAIDRSGLPRADTFPKILLYGLALLAAALLISSVSCRVSRAFTTRLDKSS